MKKMLLVASALVFAFLSTAGAETTKEEKRLDSEAAAVDKTASGPGGEKAVVERLEKMFSVDEARITSLRERKLGYGEISIVLALAQKLPGGINDENVSKVLSMREGPPVEGWGVVAKKLGTKLGPVISDVNKVKVEARKEVQKADKREKMERMEKKEKMERPMKPEKPNRPGRP